MIVCVTGLPGEGKSYRAVLLMLERFALGLPSASNIELLPEGVDAYFSGWTGWRELYRYLHINECIEGASSGSEDTMHPDNDPWTWPEGEGRSHEGGVHVAIVIDESGDFLDPDMPGGKGRISKILRRARYSDKHSQDWYLLVQDASHLHRRARKLVKFWWVMRNLQSARISWLGLPYPPPMRYNFEQWVYQQDARTKVHDRPRWVVRDSRVYACYRTEDCAVDHSRAQKMLGLGHKVSYRFPLWVPVGCVIFVFVLYGTLALI